MIRIVVTLACLLTFGNVVRADGPPTAGNLGSATETIQGTDDAGSSSNALVAPEPEIHVTSAGLVLDNVELLWIRSHDPMDSVQVIVGTMVAQSYALQRLYFATSECLAWNAEATGCLASTMRLDMASDIGYDIVGWTEAENRQAPERELILIAEDWTFRPADVNMDGVVECADLVWFSSSPYDWNLDGEVTRADLDGVVAVLAGALADLDGDGLVGVTDLLGLVTNWGPCPPAGECPGDFDCDGLVGIQDFLLWLSLMGS